MELAEMIERYWRLLRQHFVYFYGCVSIDADDVRLDIHQSAYFH
jgi:hypothetical protein